MDLCLRKDKKIGMKISKINLYTLIYIIMEFKEKYLKYKDKYLSLKQEKDGYMQGGELGFAKGSVRMSVATLNQWSTDYIGNEIRIKQAIKIAKEDGSRLILLPELATCGYSCQDHFLERETHELSFNVINVKIHFSTGL